MPTNTICLPDVKRLMEGGEPLNLIDVRTPAEFERVHAAGARLVPLDSLDPAAISACRKTPQTPIYVICHSGARASNACQRLEQAGVGPAYCIEGGTAAWEQMGLPVLRGSRKVISLERQVRIAAGLLILLGFALAWSVWRWFLILPVFIGTGLLFAGVTDYCGMGLLLGKMPWNRSPRPSES